MHSGWWKTDATTEARRHGGALEVSESSREMIHHEGTKARRKCRSRGRSKKPCHPEGSFASRSVAALRITVLLLTGAFASCLRAFVVNRIERRLSVPPWLRFLWF